MKEIASKIALVSILFAILAMPVTIAETDNTPPSPPPTADIAGSVTAGVSLATATTTKTSTLTISGTTEANAKITLYVTADGGATWAATTTTYASSTGSWTIANFSLTSYAGQVVGFAVTSTDNAGNESTRSLYGYLMYDASKPTVTITSPPTSTTTDEPSVTISGTVEFDPWETTTDITLTLQVETASVGVPIATDGGFVYSVALSEGVNTIIAQASDSLGNLGTPAVVTVTRGASTPSGASPDTIVIIGVPSTAAVIVVILYVLFLRGGRPV